MKLLGTTTINGRTFTHNDINGVISTKDDSFYGGRVRQFGLTPEGFLLCIDHDTVIDIAIEDERLTELGKELLSGKVEEMEEVKKLSVETLARTELLKMARDLKIEGKFTTFKTEILIEKIKEVLKDTRQD